MSDPAKNWGKPGETIPVPKGNIWSDALPAEIKLARRPCWQCRKISTTRHDGRTYCLNRCGPESLGRLLSLG